MFYCLRMPCSYFYVQMYTHGCVRLLIILTFNCICCIDSLCIKTAHKCVMPVAVSTARTTLNLRTLNYLTSHLTGPMVRKCLEILQGVEHRQEPSFGKHTVLLIQHIVI